MSLLPPELQWGYNDSLVLSEKKSVLQAMSQFLLINLDEFNQISPKIQEGFLKNLVQLSSVKVKRPYGRHVEDLPRLASFIDGEWMTTTAIMGYIKKRAGSLLKTGNVLKFGRVLSNIDGLISRRTKRGTEYLVKLRE